MRYVRTLACRLSLVRLEVDHRLRDARGVVASLDGGQVGTAPRVEAEAPGAVPQPTTPQHPGLRPVNNDS